MNDLTAEKAGWAIPDWCVAVNLARATFYTLPAEIRPPSVKIGKRRIVTESPHEWVQRIAAIQGGAK